MRAWQEYRAIVGVTGLKRIQIIVGLDEEWFVDAAATHIVSLLIIIIVTWASIVGYVLAISATVS